jgi:ferric-dicitrate binding protein FerR (iron transport regulator)
MGKIELDSEKINHYFNGEYTEKDSSYVENIFCDDSKEEDLKTLLSKQFDQLLPEDELNKKDLDHILYRVHYEINTRLTKERVSTFDHIIKWTLRIAGVLILPLLILLGIQTFIEPRIARETSVEIKAPAWSRVQFSLPDGTTGWLNSNSSIKYNGNFVSDRHIELIGEAFFDVFKDKKRPFVVNTNEVNVTVLGTKFNIASYDNEKNVEVVLEEGKLVFSDIKLKKFYTMNPNDLVIYNKSKKDFSTEVVQPQKYLSWTEGKLVFRNDPLDVIARRLARWYNIDIEVNVPLAEDLRLRATFIDESLDEVLSLLGRSLPINYKIEDHGLDPTDTFIKKKVIITPKYK